MLEHVREECSEHLDAIAELFKPGVKLTLIARTPDNDDADFVLTCDDLPEAIKALKRRQKAGD